MKVELAGVGAGSRWWSNMRQDLGGAGQVASSKPELFYQVFLADLAQFCCSRPSMDLLSCQLSPQLDFSSFYAGTKSYATSLKNSFLRFVSMLGFLLLSSLNVDIGCCNSRRAFLRFQLLTRLWEARS